MSAGTLPSPAVAWAAALVVFGLLALTCWRAWPPIVAEAAGRALLFAVPLAVGLLVLLHLVPARLAIGSFLASLAALSLFAAEGSRANAEAGWRRTVIWVGAALAPPLVVLVLFHWMSGPSWGPRAAVAGGVSVTLLAWVPALVVESYRVRQALREEVRLGLMPEEDLLVLTYPWRRAREPRFGQRDERREYVRSVLLLAVAHRQQTRRAGEAARLRQLEILAFRTRVRRTLEARKSRRMAERPELVDEDI